MIFVNLTPHVLNVRQTDGEILVIPASGQTARVAEELTPVRQVDGFQLRRQETGDVTGLPDYTEDTVYIVSAMVRMAVPLRNDVLSPGTLIRNDAGQPVGCDGFICN